jgi:hypothetical protein
MGLENFTLPTVCPTWGSASAARDAVQKSKTIAKHPITIDILVRFIEPPLFQILGINPA